MQAEQRWLRFRLHPSFLILGAAAFATGHGMDLVVTFLAVTLHELAHVGVARGYGLDVERVELWPFGGLAVIPGLSGQDPYVESMVAVAGPLENFLLAGILTVMQGMLPLDQRLVVPFLWSNLGLGLINLLPIAPLDGGHLARVYFARGMGYEKAEARVVRWGKGFGVAIVAVGLVLLVFGVVWWSPVIFGVFLFWGASQDQHLAVYWAVRDLHLRAVAFRAQALWPIEDFAVLGEAPLGLVLRTMRPRRYHRVAVLSDDLVVLGSLQERDLLQALRERGPDCRVWTLLPPAD